MKYLKIIFVFAGIFLSLAACSKKNGSVASIPEQASAAPKQVEADVAIPNFKNLSLEGLSTAQKKSFVLMTSEEVCPCDCPKTFSACMQSDGCKPAQLLGQWLVDRVREGLPSDIIAQALPRELAGFKGKASTLDTKGFGTKGKQSAPVTVVEFADFECGHCKEAAKVMEELVEKYPQKIKVVYKYFPLPAHKMAKVAAIAAEAANKQGKFWDMHDALYRSLGSLSEDLISGHARAIGLDMTRFEKDFKDKAVIAKVEQSISEGNALGIAGTPAIYVNGKPYSLSIDASGLELRLEMEEKLKGSTCN